MTGDELVAIVRARGSNANDPRDAAHEACHALDWDVKKPWTRDNIHARKPKNSRIFGPMPGVRAETLARAVEQLVCQRIGFDCGSVEKWAMVCWMEMLKNERISLPTDGFLEKAITEDMTSARAITMAERVLALTMPDKKKVRRA